MDGSSRMIKMREIRRGRVESGFMVEVSPFDVGPYRDLNARDFHTYNDKDHQNVTPTSAYTNPKKSALLNVVIASVLVEVYMDLSNRARGRKRMRSSLALLISKAAGLHLSCIAI
jgi:hypothetical protein